jgi:hypothetical protein
MVERATHGSGCIAPYTVALVLTSQYNKNHQSCPIMRLTHVDHHTGTVQCFTKTKGNKVYFYYNHRHDLSCLCEPIVACYRPLLRLRGLPSRTAVSTHRTIVKTPPIVAMSRINKWVKGTLTG